MICEHEKIDEDGDLVCTYYNDGMPCYVKDAWSAEDCEHFQQVSEDRMIEQIDISGTRFTRAGQHGDVLGMRRMIEHSITYLEELIERTKAK